MPIEAGAHQGRQRQLGRPRGALKSPHAYRIVFMDSVAATGPAPAQQLGALSAPTAVPAAVADGSSGGGRLHQCLDPRPSMLVSQDRQPGKSTFPALPKVGSRCLVTKFSRPNVFREAGDMKIHIQIEVSPSEVPLATELLAVLRCGWHHAGLITPIARPRREIDAGWRAKLLGERLELPGAGPTCLQCPRFAGA